MSENRPQVFPGWEEHRRTDRPHAQRIFAGVPAPVVAIAAIVDGEPTAMVATSFSVGVSHEPPMCLFAVQQSSRTWPRLASVPRVGVSVLGEGHAEVVQRLASREVQRRFEGVQWTTLPSGAVTLYGAPVWLECEVVQQHEAGDHLIVVLQVHGSSAVPDHAPLIHHEAVFGTFSPSTRRTAVNRG
jgi:flavin reductase (DIM6/NTAB) family NADH-FMN oxidoreductase RutF